MNVKTGLLSIIMSIGMLVACTNRDPQQGAGDVGEVHENPSTTEDTIDSPTRERDDTTKIEQYNRGDTTQPQ